MANEQEGEGILDRMNRMHRIENGRVVGVPSRES
jgi:hypothetical protein